MPINKTFIIILSKAYLTNFKVNNIKYIKSFKPIIIIL